MYIIKSTPNGSGGYPALQSWSSINLPEGNYFCPDEFYDTFYPEGKRGAGFVTYTVEDDTVTSMAWNDEAYNAWVATLPPEPDPVEQAIEAKNNQLSSTCQQKINAGADVELSIGTEHFSYTLADQSNISEMFNAVVLGATEYPYHADDGSCTTYSATDIATIYSTLSMMKTREITYQNQLKQYVKTLTDIETIEAVEYGQELTGEYLTNYTTLVAQAQEQMSGIMSRLASTTSIGGEG